MKKLREIVEATKSLHPMALHVKPVMVNGQQKYKVHAVGKGLADGINHGEHLSDSELDDAHEMGAKVKHVKESVDEAMSHQAKTTMKHIPNPSPALKKAAKDIKPGIAGFRDRIAMLKAGGVKEEVEIVYEANIQPTAAKSRSHIGNLSHPTTNHVVHPSSGKEIGLITKQPDGKYHAHPSSVKLSHNQGGTFDTKDQAHQHIRDAHAKAIKTDTLSDRWKKSKPLPQFAKEETGFGPEADKNITVQLKKAMDMMEHGEKTGSDVEFADGQQHFVEGVIAHKVLVAMEQMKPEIRAQAQNAVYQSFAHLMAAHQMLSK